MTIELIIDSKPPVEFESYQLALNAAFKPVKDGQHVILRDALGELTGKCEPLFGGISFS